MRHRLLIVLVLAALVVSACAEVGAQTPTDSSEADKSKVEKMEKTEKKVAEKSKAKSAQSEKTLKWPPSCPVTVLGNNAFTPAAKSPEGPPDYYDSVWYGTPELYTMLNPEGGDSLNRWLGGEKTFWWSENFFIENEFEPEIAVTARQLDGKATFEATQTTHAMIKDTRDAMLVGVTLSEPGCWEITAAYKGASLSYVVWVQPKG